MIYSFDRRRFLLTAGTIVTGSLINTQVLGRTAGGTPYDQSRLPIPLTIYDSRLAEGERFGSAIGANGMRVLGFDGDITSLWSDHIEPAWKNGDRTLAGLTCERNMTCLVELARDYRIHLVHLARHAADGNMTRTSVHTRVGTGDHTAFKDGSAEVWPTRAARLILDVPTRGKRLQIGDFMSPATTGFENGPLVSWILAPTNAGQTLPSSWKEVI
jgi:hypothetical protein